MEINPHVYLPELGLTANLAMLGPCERSADLDRFRSSSSFSDWQQCNRGSTETYHNMPYNSRSFHSFCYFLHQHQNYSPIFIPSTNFTCDCFLREKKKKLTFTLLPHCSGTKLLYIYYTLPHFWRRGNIIVRGHYFTTPRTRQQAKWRYYTANHMQMELTFYSRVRAELRGR